MKLRSVLAIWLACWSAFLVGSTLIGARLTHWKYWRVLPDEPLPLSVSLGRIAIMTASGAELIALVFLVGFLLGTRTRR